MIHIKADYLKFKTNNKISDFINRSVNYGLIF